MEFPRGQTGKIVCVLMPEVSTEVESHVKTIRDWSAKAKVSGATIRTTIAGMHAYAIAIFCELVCSINWAHASNQHIQAVASGDIDQIVAYSPEGFVI